MRSNTYIIPAVKGLQRAIHVFVPAMRHRQAHPESYIPSVCVRCSSNKYRAMQVFEKIEVLGPSSLGMVKRPLYGTGGRAQVLLLTEHNIKVWSYVKGEAPIIEIPKEITPEEVFQKILNKYGIDSSSLVK